MSFHCPETSLDLADIPDPSRTKEGKRYENRVKKIYIHVHVGR